MSAVPLLDQHKGCHCAERRPSIFRRALRMPWRKPAAPEVPSITSGAATALLAGGDSFWDDKAPGRHAATDPAGIPVLGDRMLSEVREQYDGEPYAPAPWRPVPTFTSTPETAHAQAMHDLSARFLPAPETIGGYPVTYHRPVNGVYRGTQPRRGPADPAAIPTADGEHVTCPACGFRDGRHNPRGCRRLEQLSRRRVYGEAPQLDVERDMAIAAGLRARERYEPASPALLAEVRAGLEKL